VWRRGRQCCQWFLFNCDGSKGAGVFRSSIGFQCYCFLGLGLLFVFAKPLPTRQCLDLTISTSLSDHHSHRYYSHTRDGNVDPRVSSTAQNQRRASQSFQYGKRNRCWRAYDERYSRKLLLAQDRNRHQEGWSVRFVLPYSRLGLIVVAS